MEELKMLKVLNRIKVCIERDSLDIAKDLTKLEIENLQGITEQKCKENRLYCDNWYCYYCSNTNCSGNLNN